MNEGPRLNRKAGARGSRRRSTLQDNVLQTLKQEIVMASDATLSLRVPQHVRDRLDRAARKTRRPLSYLMQRALERHLDDIEREESGAASPGRYAGLLAMQGAAIGADGPPTSQEIDDYIRWLRDDDRIPG